MSHKSDLLNIPWIGPKTVDRLNQVGIYHQKDLVGLSPEGLYDELQIKNRQNLNIVVLYVLRCAIYFVSHHNHDPRLLQWWNWRET